MTVETHLPAAASRVERERTAVARKADAYAAFLDRLHDIAEESAPAPGVATGARSRPVPDHGPGGSTLAATGTDAGGAAVAADIRDAFDGTVVAVTDDAPGSDPVSAELGDEVGLALAPETATPGARGLVEGVTDAARKRRRQLRSTAAALDREATSLSGARCDVTTVREWLGEADRTPLSALGFDTLRERHERLGDFRDRCADRLDERQDLLASSTSANSRIGLEHRPLVEYLYDEFPFGYPVLDAVVRTARVCRRCQRAVRSHLVWCG